MKSLANFLEVIDYIILRIPRRVLADDTFFLSWKWLGTCLLVSVLCTLLFSPNLKRSGRVLIAHLSSRRARRELTLDFKFIALKALLEPLKLFLFGNISILVFRQVEQFVNPVVKIWIPGPVIHLDSFWGVLSNVLFIMLLADFFSYLVHWMQHRYGVFWSLHRIHHRTRYLTPLAKYRLHPLDESMLYVISAIGVGIGVSIFRSLIWIPGGTPWITSMHILIPTYYFLGHLRHSHFWISYGPYLSYLLVSPAMHQIHHSSDSKHLNKNFGVIFSIWDYMFGTLYIPRKKEKIRAGIYGEGESPAQSLTEEIMLPLKDLMKKPMLEKNLGYRRQSGLTMVELMASLPVVLMVMLLAGGMILGLFSMTEKTSVNIEAEQNLNTIVYRVRQLAHLGIDVRYVPGNLSGTRSAQGEGYVRSFNYQRFSDMSEPATPIMYFARESTRSGNVNANSGPQATAVFFKAPTRDFGKGNIGSGEILIATAPSVSAAGSRIVLSAAAAQTRIPGVVGLSLYEPLYSRNGVLASIKMKITMRSFLSSENSLPKKWCPAPDAALCSGGAPYRDFDRIILLNFDNNRREVSSGSYEFPFGLYFFLPVDNVGI